MFKNIVTFFVLGVMTGLLLGGLVFKAFDVVRVSAVLLSISFEVRLFLWVLVTNSAAFAALYLISQYSRGGYVTIFIYVYGVLAGLLTTPYGIAGLVSMIPHGTLELYAMGRVVRMTSETITVRCVVITAMVIAVAAFIEAFVDVRIMYVLSLLTV
ncbi:hypothetical protein [Vulcanisaeta distributa]|uniref:hypothetical protein n=1 Tax=Vulcanisaeta distributa TaxID=164451 RepID=UPI000AD108EA|nr:hypothetical protein [Vulcanisaeta distributa]